MSSYNNSRPDASSGKNRFVIYSLIKLTEKNWCVALTCGLQVRTSRDQRTTSAAVRGLDKRSHCATALVTRGADCRHFQTNKQNDCASLCLRAPGPVLPSLFSRIWTVSPISRMRAWHIGDRKLQITVRKKKDKKKAHNENRRQKIYISTLL